MDKTLKRGKSAHRQAYQVKESCSCVWTGSADSSSNYHSISTERKQFSHTSDRGTPARCKKKKKKVTGREMQPHTVLVILGRQWWKETTVYSTINVKINRISLMVHFW